MYKIYRKNNYIVIESTARREVFYGGVKDVFVDKNNVNLPIYRFFNVKNWDGNTSIAITDILKEDNSAYTIEEFETFYTENTADFKLGLDGKSAYQSALDGGFVGTESEFNVYLSEVGQKANFLELNTYAQMIALTSVNSLTIVKVLNDENKGITNTVYQIYPDGVRMWIAANKDN